MSERRPATTIGELDIHLGFLMDEIREMSKQLAGLATKDELDKEVASIRAELADRSVGGAWRKLTSIAVGVSALAASVGVVVAVFRYLKL